jgi:excisionase family DNA binding protein
MNVNDFSRTSGLISLGEAASRLAVSLRLLQRLILQGELPIVRISQRRIGIAERDLDAFVAARRTSSQAPNSVASSAQSSSSLS